MFASQSCYDTDNKWPWHLEVFFVEAKVIKVETHRVRGDQHECKLLAFPCGFYPGHPPKLLRAKTFAPSFSVRLVWFSCCWLCFHFVESQFEVYTNDCSTCNKYVLTYIFDLKLRSCTMCLLYMSDLWPLIEQTTSNHYPTSLCSAHHFAAAWMPRATAKDLQSCIHFVAGSSKKPWSRISENQHFVSFASTQYFIVVFCWFYMVLFAAGLEDLAGSEKQKKTHASGERLQASVAPLWSNTSFLPDRQIPKISRLDKIRRCYGIPSMNCSNWSAAASLTDNVEIIFAILHNCIITPGIGCARKALLSTSLFPPWAVSFRHQIVK